MEFNATLIIAAVSFISFVLIMNWILYRPIEKIMQKRKELIDGNYNEAKNNSLKSDDFLQKKDEEIKNATTCARNNLNKSKEEANNKKSALISDAKKEAQTILENKKEELLNSEKLAKEELKSQIINLAQLISDKFISGEEKITVVDNEIIEKAMQG